MIRKTAFLAAASSLMLTAPALAQDAPAQQTPAATPPAAAPAQAPSLTLQPGSTVKGSDGAALGQLVGARTNASGQQELTVRGSDGQLRAVPLAGLRQDGADVVVGWTAAEFQASTAIEADATTPDTADTAAEEPDTPPADPQS